MGYRKGTDMTDDKNIIDFKEVDTEGKEILDDENKDEFEKVCFLCRRPESKTGPMITLPQNIHICTDCMQKSFDTMNSGTIQSERSFKI